MKDAGYKDGDSLGGKMFPTLYENIIWKHLTPGLMTRS
jgi:hypothetical protein